MRLLSRLESALGRFAVPHLTLGLVLAQVVVYFVASGMNARLDAQDQTAERVEMRLALIPERVLEGEVWRLGTFLLLPPFTNFFFALFSWYFFWLAGTTLERSWGVFRYNLYLLVGTVATAAAAFLTPERPATNAFLTASVLLAFAWLAPDFRLFFYFVLPIPIKWIAWLTWAGLGLMVAIGSWAEKAQAVAVAVNFLVFFGRDVWYRVGREHRAMAREAARIAAEATRPNYFHKCRVCGITDRTHKTMDFRYCSKCAGSCCYCAEHLRNHEHVQ